MLKKQDDLIRRLMMLLDIAVVIAAFLVSYFVRAHFDLLYKFDLFPSVNVFTKPIPIERYIGNDETISYIALRADEDRAGYISTKPNIKPVFPFMRDGLVKGDILKIVEKSGIGMPEYYSWRTRSGCYFCFFQRKIEWVRLSEVHPKLFKKAMIYEQKHEDGREYFWSQDESLLDLMERKDQIIADHNKAMLLRKRVFPKKPLVEVFESILEDERDDFCFVCN